MKLGLPTIIGGILGIAFICSIGCDWCAHSPAYTGYHVNGVTTANNSGDVRNADGSNRSKRSSPPTDKAIRMTAWTSRFGKRKIGQAGRANSAQVRAAVSFDPTREKRYAAGFSMRALLLKTGRC